MPILRRILLLLVLSVILSGCNLIFSRAPGIYVLDTGLGTYDDRPTWFWEVYGPDLVQGFRYSIGSETDWIEVVDEIRTYQPPAVLASGEHTLFLQAKSVSGLWSSTVSATAIVETASPYTPNDSYFVGTASTEFVGQWALAEIKMPELWRYIRGIDSRGVQRSEVVVGVIDTGYTDHPDLEPNLLISDGYDFVREDLLGDGDDIDGDATDPGDGSLPFVEHSWHGTGVASIIAALTDNGGIGIAGIGLSKLKVLPVRALGPDGGTTYDIAQAIRYAAGLSNDSGSLPARSAKIINLSIGAYVTSDPYVEPSLEEAVAAGAIIIASAGNERGEGKTEVAYPASSPYTIAVAATTAAKTIAPYSNPGDMVDIAAPGGLGDDSQHPDYTGTWFDWVVVASPDFARDQPLALSDYIYAGIVGTSIAAPHVAGVLALLCTVSPAMDLAMAREVLRRSAVDLGTAGKDRDFGHGLLDAVAAMGAYNLILATGWTAAAATRSVSDKSEVPQQGEPSGELAVDSLIVRYATNATAKNLDTRARIQKLGVSQVGAPSGRDQLLRPHADADPSSVRRALLKEPDVESVYFNYIYRPL